MTCLIKKAITRGQFKLSCGIESSYLVDMAKVLRTIEGQKFIEYITIPFMGQYDIMGGPLSAADLLCPRLGAQKWFGVRSKPKDRGTDRGCITGNLEVGQRVLMIEDVCTSGGTLIRATEEVIKFGAIVVAVFAIVDRFEHGGIQAVCDKFKIPGAAYYSFSEAEQKTSKAAHLSHDA